MVDDFYHHLEACREEVIREFLTFSGMGNPDIFLSFFESFKKNRYLQTYTNTAQIAYALKRICMRVWANPFTPEHEAGITNILIIYRETLLDNFLSVFKEIGAKLSTDQPRYLS